jgi:presequence protease
MSPDKHFLRKEGEKYNDFVVTKILPIHELQCLLRELVHEPTGASVIHIENNDPENLFCLSFKTLPYSSNGVAHILEHTVLCGSKKFPVKDPFFAMSRRSLNTFMNALTGSDFTCYPAASMVEKDFYNLLEVYLDAVFHPLLKELSFLQEGFRLEFSDSKNPKSPLEFKGIVYNEMKGTLASADARLWNAMMESLCPDLPYAFNSGGDPKVIPQLTYPELVAFHETYYHPSRCLFFFYGNLPLKKHLDFIFDKALKTVPKSPPSPALPLQPRFKVPVLRKMHYPVNETEETKDRTIISFGWLTASLLSQQEVLALSVLDVILMENDGSLLKLPLLQSGLCIQADSYVDTEMSEVPYLIVCKGCDEENVEKLQEALQKSLLEIVQRGIPLHLVENAIHQFEFSRTEITGDMAPFGLTLFMRSALAKQHGCDPENALMIHSLFDTLKLKAKDPQYFPDLIKKHLLNNSHFVRLVMVPDPKLSSEELAEEKETLQQIQDRLTQEETEKILKQAETLSLYQKQTEAQSLECLPKIELKDVPLYVQDFPLSYEQFRDLHIYHHECFTNHIVYADLIFDLPKIAEEDLPYVQLLITLMPEIGAKDRTYAENLEYIQAHTGGVGISCSLHPQVDSQKLNPCLVIRGKALHRKTDKLFSLLRDMAQFPRFDEKKRIEELILQLNSSLQNRFNRNAMRYAIQLALSGFSKAQYIQNSWYGLKYFKTIQEMAKNLDKKLPEIIDKLMHLKDQLLCLKSPHLVLSCNEEIYGTLKKESFFGLSDLSLKDFPPWSEHYRIEPIPSQARAIASLVAFTAEAFKVPSYLHPHAPGLSVATHLFENKLLHKVIREQGGAYGASASYSPMLGSLYFHAYRDPHLARTLKTFQDAIELIAGGHFDERDLEEAKLGMVQGMDIPVSPGSRAITAYSWRRDGKTKEMRQHYRDRILHLHSKDVQAIVQKEILPQKDLGVVVSFAGKEFLNKENLLLAQEHKELFIVPI